MSELATVLPVTATRPRGAKPLVAILALPEATASVIYGLHDLLLCPGRDWGLMVSGQAGECLLQPRIVAARAGLMTIANGVQLVADAAFTDLPVPDVICVPELFVAPNQPPAPGQFDAEIAWLRHCHAEGALLATACSGAVLLAEAGLLDGCDATIHWAYCDALEQRYPRVRVQRQRALVVSGEGQRLVMAGGGTSWLDLALYLIARYAGVQEAMQVARLSLIDWHASGQQPFARLARTRQVEDAAIAKAQVWIAEHYAAPAPVAAMVRASGLAERSFKRRFQQATGLSPLQYVHTLRLEEAKQLLETGEQSVEWVALEVGYEDAAFFSRLFRREVRLTPAQYRRRFGALRQSLPAVASSVQRTR